LSSYSTCQNMMRYFLKLFSLLFLCREICLELSKKREKGSEKYLQNGIRHRRDNDGAKICGMPSLLFWCAFVYVVIILLSKHLNRNIVETFFSFTGEAKILKKHNLNSPTTMIPCILNRKQVKILENIFVGSMTDITK